MVTVAHLCINKVMDMHLMVHTRHLVPLYQLWDMMVNFMVPSTTSMQLPITYRRLLMRRMPITKLPLRGRHPPLLQLTRHPCLWKRVMEMLREVIIWRTMDQFHQGQTIRVHCRPQMVLMEEAGCREVLLLLGTRTRDLDMMVLFSLMDVREQWQVVLLLRLLRHQGIRIFTRFHWWYARCSF